MQIRKVHIYSGGKTLKPIKVPLFRGKNEQIKACHIAQACFNAKLAILQGDLW